MARTTLDIDDGVLRELKRRRTRDGKPLGVIASELLAQALAAGPSTSEPLVWRSGDLGTKIDLEDRDALWAVLDEG